MAGHGPAAHHVGVVGAAVAMHLLGVQLAVAPEVPAVMQPLANHEAQAVMPGQRLRAVRLAMAGQIIRRGAQHAPAVGGQRQRHQAGIRRLAKADGQVHRLAVHIAQPVGYAQAQLHIGVLLLKLVEPAQRQVAAKIRWHRQVQRIAQQRAFRVQRGAGLLVGVQQLAGVG